MFTIRDSDIFKIRDAVDIYIIGGEVVEIYFMNTRRRMQFKSNQFSVYGKIKVQSFAKEKCRVLH